MLEKLYINNYKNFRNFELNTSGLNSLLILGKNGVGKSNVLKVIEFFQKIGKSITQVGDLISESDFYFGDKSLPIVFELEIILKNDRFKYKLEIDYPKDFKSPRVSHELLLRNGENVFERKNGKMSLGKKSNFTLDWHHVGLPLISTRDENDPIELFKDYLSNIVVLSAIPSQFCVASKQENRYLNYTGSNSLDWIRYHLSKNPSLYTQINSFLKFRMDDFELFKFESTGKDERELIFEFRHGGKTTELNFALLSDGEKIFFLAAVLLAVISKDKNILCFWDEPDGYISLMELGNFVTSCRKAFDNSKTGSQLIMTSHKAKTINDFSTHNTFIFARDSHLSSTRVKKVNDFSYVSPTFEEAYENGEFE